MPPPYYCETGPVEHFGGVKHEGNFVHTLTLIAIQGQLDGMCGAGGVVETKLG